MTYNYNYLFDCNGPQIPCKSNVEKLRKHQSTNTRKTASVFFPILAPAIPYQPKVPG